MSQYFQYPLYRNIALRYFTPTFIVLGLIWIFFVTLINVAVAGYESVVITSTNFSSNTRPWYEHFLPKLYSLPSWNCSYTVIKVNDGYFFPRSILTKGMQPYSQLFVGYNLIWFIDQRDDIPVDGMEYADYSIRNCSIQQLQMGQWMSAAGTSVVITLFVSKDNMKAYIACNTSAGQYFFAQTSDECRGPHNPQLSTNTTRDSWIIQLYHPPTVG